MANNFTVNGIDTDEYKNLKKFEAWLNETAKRPCDLDETLKELEAQYAASGAANYELRSCETKSGNPECYYYRVEEPVDEGGEPIFVF